MLPFWRRSTRTRRTATAGPQPLTSNTIDAVLHVHQNVHVEIGEDTYSCRVHDFGSTEIHITAPLDENALPILLPVRTPIRVVLLAREAFLGFEAHVESTRVVDGIPLFTIPKPKEAQLTDRRAYYRVPTDLPVQYRLGEGQDYGEGRIANISGGGALCLLPRDIAPERNTTLELCFALPTAAQPLQIRALVHLVKSPSPRSMYCKVGCEFVDLPKQTREVIIRYVTQRQLELIRSGVL